VSPVDLLYGILISALFAIEGARAYRVRQRFVPPQPLLKQGPYRSGGSPGNAAIDILLEEFNREEPKPIATISSATPQPEIDAVVTLLALEHRVDAVVAEVGRLNYRLHELEKQRVAAVKRVGVVALVMISSGVGVTVAHMLIDLWR